MTDDDALDLLDAKAVVLSRCYQKEGEVGFVLRTLDNGDIRLIGPDIAPHLVINVCRALADSLEKRTYAADPRKN